MVYRSSWRHRREDVVGVLLSSRRTVVTGDVLQRAIVALRNTLDTLVHRSGRAIVCARDPSNTLYFRPQHGVESSNIHIYCARLR